jgi:inorganic pyrophosphatase
MDLTKIDNDLDPKTLCVRAVVETPRGGRNKFAYDPKIKAFRLHFLLPEGMAFPLDFGFIPGTKADDGDPVDVLVLADDPLPTGAVVKVRLLADIEAEQSDAKETVRNDRLLAISEHTHLFGKVRTVEDLGPNFLEQLTSFFTNYNALRGRKFKVLKTQPAEAAAALITKRGRQSKGG